MSYPNLSGYGSYYPAASDQRPQGQYNSRQSTSTNDGSSRSNQYGQTGYSWRSQGQNQNEYSTSTADHQAYPQGTWKSNQDEQSYNYQQQPSYNAPATSAPPSIPYYTSKTQTSSRVSTAALNSLAYASGLEAAGIQGTRASQNNTPVNVGYPNLQASGVGQERTKSPAQGAQNGYPYSVHDGTGEHRPRSSQSQRSLIASAAAALTGTADLYQQQQSPPATSANYQQARRTSASYQQSAALGTANSTPAAKVPPTGKPGWPDSPYTARPPATQDVFQSGKSASQSKGYGKVTSADIHRRANTAIFDDTSRSQENDQSGTADTSYQAQTTINGSMPTFIDPSEVFNPYHYELEQRRRDAAQADIPQQQQIPVSVVDNTPAPSSTAPPPSDNKSATNPAAEAGVSHSAKKPRKPREKKARESKPAPFSEPPIAAQSLIPQSVEPDEENIASEMKTMIEKMRSWKTKDPKLFAQLWEGMKKAPDTASTQPQSPQPSQATPKSVKSLQQSKKSTTTSSNSKAIPQSSVPSESNTVDSPAPIRFSAERVASKPQQPPIISTSHNLPAGYHGLDGTTSPLMGQKQPTALIAAQVAANTSVKITWKDTAPPASTTQAAQSAKQPVLAQSLPTMQANGKTVWPEEKRISVAEAAAAFLNSDPANAGGITTPNTIQKVLAKNPSYKDLCERLEILRLVFDRSKLANHLLRSVPGITPSQSLQQPPGSSPQVGQGQRQASVPVQFSTVPRALQNFDRGPSVKPSVKPAAPARTTKKSGVPDPPPGSKAAMARKRDFAELVDMSQLSDYDDDDEPPGKQPRIASPPPTSQQSSFSTAQQSVSTLQSATPLKFDVSGFGKPHPQPSSYTPYPPYPHFQASYPGPSFGQPSAYPQQSSAYPSGPAYQSRPQTNALQAMVPVVKTLDKKAALRRSYYNPKTVARDVLIAAGRHPTERPLNYHLATIMSRVPSLSQTPQADLSTFDWDAIDPGGPPMPKVTEVDIENAPPKFALRAGAGGRPSLSDSAKAHSSGQRGAHFNTVNSKTTANANQLLAAQLSLKRHLTQGSDLLHNVSKPKESGLPSRLSDVINVNEVRSESREAAPATPRKSRPENTISPQASMTSTTSLSGARRGRPPGAKNKVPAESTQRISIPISQPPPQFPTYRCQWRDGQGKKCQAELHNLHKLRRHIEKVHQPASENDKFECWWRRCPFVEKVKPEEFKATKQWDTKEEWLKHLDEEHLWDSAWRNGDGPSDTPVGKDKVTPTGLARYAYDPNLSNVKPAPYPNSSSGMKTQTVKPADPQILEQQRKAYTADALTGRQITPIASKHATKERPLDAMIIPTNYDNAKTFMKTHSETHSKKASAEELLRAHKFRKEKIGAGIDRGGATLVTVQVRATLIQDEGIARVVEDDEDSDDGNL